MKENKDRRERQDRIDIKSSERGELLDVDSGQGGRFQNIPKELPFQPLINTVIFPSVVAPLVIGKKRSILAVQKAAAETVGLMPSA